MTIRTTAQLLAGLDAALAWLERYGVRVQETRFARYRRLLGREVPGQDRPFEEWRAQLKKEFYAAAMEIFDVVEIATLPEVVMEGHRAKAQQLAIGPSFYDDDQALGNDQGRDTAFELLTASVLHRAGESPTLDRPADVNLARQGFSALIECKRPQTEQGCVDLMIRASAQFSRHRRAGHLGVGVVALDFTRLINPELAILPAQTSAEAANSMDQQMLRKVCQISERLNGFRNQMHVDGEISAVLIRCSVMTIIETEDYRPEVLTQMHVYPQDLNPESVGFQSALQLGQILHAAGVNCL